MLSTRSLGVGELTKKTGFLLDVQDTAPQGRWLTYTVQRVFQLLLWHDPGKVRGQHSKGRMGRGQSNEKCSQRPIGGYGR